MGKWWFPSLLLLLSTQIICQSVVKVNRCCHPGQILNRARDRCVPQSSQVPIAGGALRSPLVPLAAPNNDISFGVLATWPTSEGLKVQADVSNAAMPKCGRTEAHPIGSKAWLTAEGGMVTEKYEKEFPHGDFCLERDIDQELVAVMCDPCQEKICLKLCCPHGKIFKPNYEAPPDPDGKPSDHCSPDSLQWSPKFWHHEDEVEVKLERHSDYVLQLENTADGAFHCPKKHSLLPDNVNFDDFKMNQKGIGTGSFLGTNTTTTFTNSQYCVTFAHIFDYDIDYEYGEEIPIAKRVAFLVCNPEEDEFDADDVCVSNIYKSVSIVISCIFLFFTIIIHMLLPQLHNYLIGKMTIGFLINMFICYVSLAYLYLKVLNKESLAAIIGTPGCTFLGYLIQYSFLAFFFWLNSMAAYIFLKTTKIVHFNIYHDAKQLIIFFIYSQVFPFFISIATAIVDMTETEDNYGRRKISKHVKPNMGQYSCFLGAEEQYPPPPFYKTPEFVYFHSFMLSILVLNVIYFTVTLVIIGMANMSSRRSSEGALTNNHNLRLVLTLFFLMGIPWVSELIGSYAKVSCGVEIFLDIINLFAGPLIFLVLVVKKEILVNLKNLVMGRYVVGTLSRDNIGMTTLS